MPNRPLALAEPAQPATQLIAENTNIAAPLVLHAHQVHIWQAALPQVDAQALLDAMGLLSFPERAQHGRFHFEKDRHCYLVTRWMVRTVLSRYVPSIAPADWAFEPGPYGHPHITSPLPAAQALRFNLSHCDGLVVLAVTAGREVGIDTENTSRHAPLEVADHFFSPREAQALRSLPAAEQALRFWELWTFKESYIKARGMGVSLPLAQFSIALDTPGRVAIAFDGIADDPAAWQLWHYQVGPHYRVALCLQRGGPQPTEVSFWNFQLPDDAQPAEVCTTRCSAKC
jgi:4'-phosphopantetheinyl transferase